MPVRRRAARGAQPPTLVSPRSISVRSQPTAVATSSKTSRPAEPITLAESAQAALELSARLTEPDVAPPAAEARLQYDRALETRRQRVPIDVRRRWVRNSEPSESE